MSFIRPFPAIQLTSQVALQQQIISPPYDTLTVEQARDYAKDNPYSFLHITRPEIDLSVDSDPYAQQVYEQGSDNLQHFFEQAYLKVDDQDAYYLYRIISGDHVQTGIAVAIDVAALEQQWVRKHELTRPEKVSDRMNLMKAQQANVSPVLLTYRQQSSLQALIQQLTKTSPDYDVPMVDQSRHQLWRISDEKALQALGEQLNNLPTIYIADGHHRCACAAEIAKQNRGTAGNNLADHFLAVLFADDETQILSYNRVVRDLNGLSPEQFIKTLAAHVSCEMVNQAVIPQLSNEFGLYVDHQWYRLSAESSPQADTLAQLPVSLLQQHILEPLLNITDQRTDKRIDFVGGHHSVTNIINQVDSGHMAAGFTLYPTTVEQLLQVADAHQVMPPKSTWFEPKLADGLLGFLF